MHQRPLLLVILGGMIGTALRIGASALIPDGSAFPVATLAVNTLGSFLLGFVATRLSRSASLRLFLGTGVLGGFTTYSAFALGIQQAYLHAPLLAVGFAAVSLILGMAAVALGAMTARSGARQ